MINSPCSAVWKDIRNYECIRKQLKEMYHFTTFQTNTLLQREMSLIYACFIHALTDNNMRQYQKSVTVTYILLHIVYKTNSNYRSYICTMDRHNCFALFCYDLIIIIKSSLSSLIMSIKLDLQFLVYFQAKIYVLVSTMNKIILNTHVEWASIGFINLRHHVFTLKKYQPCGLNWRPFYKSRVVNASGIT